MPAGKNAEKAAAQVIAAANAGTTNFLFTIFTVFHLLSIILLANSFVNAKNLPLRYNAAYNIIDLHARLGYNNFMSTKNSKKVINVILTAIFCVCLVLLMITFSIGVPIYVRYFYYLQIDALKLPEQTGWTFSQIKQAYDEVLNFCTLPGREFSSGILKFSEEGAAHFADCKVLFDLNLGVLISSAAVTLLLGVLNKLKVITLMQVKGHRAYFISAIVAVALPLIIILIILAVGFDKAFEGFHAVFFPGKDNWIFDPSTDEIIQVMPQEFFANCAIIIATTLIGFASALIVADLVLKNGANRSYRVYLYTPFIIAETAIYISFNVLIFVYGADPDAIKYAGIITCILISAINIVLSGKDAAFLTAAMIFTAIADWFLLIIYDNQEIGVASFLVVQLIYFVRIYRISGKKWYISAGVRVALPVIILIVLAVLGKITLMTALVALYFPQLLINAVDSAFLIKLSKRYIMLFIGYLLFIGCDICVGLHNLAYIGNGLPENIDYWISNLVWIFYLPSQVLITLTATTKAEMLAQSDKKPLPAK